MGPVGVKGVFDILKFKVLMVFKCHFEKLRISRFFPHSSLEIETHGSWK